MKIWYFFIEGAYFGIFLVEGGAGGIEISRGGGGGYRIFRGGGYPLKILKYAITIKCILFNYGYFFVHFKIVLRIRFIHKYNFNSEEREEESYKAVKISLSLRSIFSI